MHKYDSACIEKGTQKVAIVGARGYSGLELVRILLKHPNVKIEACFANEADFALSDYLPESAAAKVKILPMQDFDKIATQVSTIFLATPADVSLKLAPRALAVGANVVDLSGAFRLTAEEAQAHYALPTESLALLSQAEYGLVPWAGPLTKTGPRLISNPGCYATAVLMGLLPLLKSKQIDASTLVIDAKSGATGAGKKASENLLFTEVEGECLPYRVGKHQHLPEIRQYAKTFGTAEIDPMFVTHLLPVRRGILAGIYARTAPGVTLATIEAAYQSAYSTYPLVRAAKLDESKRQLLTLKRVVGSARCEIQFELKGTHLYVFSMIDNLMKGAASQAIENFNRLNDFPLTTALNELEGTL
jgi:N-acetyl-gamma-glutamyl-phosphate reductase